MILKKIVSYIGFFISIYNIYALFSFMSPIKTVVLFGYWGQPVNKQYSTQYDVRAFKLEDFGLSREIALVINYSLTYLHLILLFAIFGFFCFFLAKKVYYWSSAYNTFIWGNKAEIRPVFAYNFNGVFILTVLLFIFYALSSMLKR